MDFSKLHTFARSTIVDKSHGVITGSALGDTIGLYTEFLPKTQFEEYYPDGTISLVDPVTPRAGDRHRDGFEERAWTDDTDHALLIVFSLLRNEGRFLPVDFATRLLSWAEQGLRCLDRLPMGLGRTVKTVILKKGFVDDPASVAQEYWLKSGKKIAPNGSLMRTHPLGIATISLTRKERYSIATEYSKTTHADPRCVVSCCIATAAIAEILTAELETEADLDALIEDAYEWVMKEYRPDPELTDAGLERDEFTKYAYAKTLAELQLDDSQKMGYVYKCLASGILCLRLAMREPPTALNVFETIVMDLIKEGGDADTNGACAGALLGAWLGYSRIPSTWSGGIKNGEWLVKKTDALCQIFEILDGNYAAKEDEDTILDKERGLFDRNTLERREQELLAKILTRDKERRDKAQAAEAANSKGKGLGRFFKKT